MASGPDIGYDRNVRSTEEREALMSRLTTRMDGALVRLFTNVTPYGDTVCSAYVIHADGCTHDIRRADDGMESVPFGTVCGEHMESMVVAVDERGEAFAALDVAAAAAGIRYNFAPWSL